MDNLRLTTENIYPHLLQAIEESSSIYFLTSFIQKSGAALLADPLRKAAARGADIKICTGDYLYITSPDALELLSSIDGVDLRLYRSGNRGFHPKAYLFRKEDEGLMIIGSANLSESALKSGVEWNLSVNKDVDPLVFEQALEEYMKVFHHEKTVEVHPETIKGYRRDYEEYHRTYPEMPEEESELSASDGRLVETVITPHEIQREALRSLDATMEEGYDRAMVVMATGLGKTYMSAFFADQMKFGKILFIAHREEILRQAEATFLGVNSSWRTGFFNGSRKERDAEVLFASIHTLSMLHHLSSFRPDEFDLIIVDEFHHAAAKSYRRVIGHFHPRFLLGMTATPDRLDGGDIYVLCDNNLAFQMDFVQAIERKFLVPFRYQGIYDDIDYSQIRYADGRYNREQLDQAYIQESMAKKIHQKWMEFRQSRTLVFCSSVRQAQFLSDYFNQQGNKTVALHAGTKNRIEAVRALREGRIEAIFTVDLFNEGVDIPPVDTLLFVRPTESVSVFIQQLGRGLRLAEGKSHCQVIDLIGNYRNLEVKLKLFGELNRKNGKTEFAPSALPDICEFELDTQAIDFIARYHEQMPLRKRRLMNSYHDVKQKLGRRPEYLELHLHGWEDVRGYKQEWGSFPEFLLDVEEELSDKERSIIMTYKDLIRDVERTAMSRSYKMVLLKCMLERGPAKWAHPITARDVAPFFYQYLADAPYRKQKDLTTQTLKGGYREKAVSQLIQTMPMNKWAGSSKGIFGKEGDAFYVEGYQSIHSVELHRFISEICEYRLHAYFERGTGNS
ncbi:DEAD/DEAH box helicase family protein [Kroppenstedtia eburnea]|uniref:Superfamily II DNA or RNA helicase n=1 Tax=Kroppenstedtia eburnea TaxID=714067 RepID=A0A1N7LM62_9BACL|nr:DEAD/DEAH box helicase family protein [Kroppenstedtia eburnea]QKI81261.1 DEAD/DEAH box helicase family protein [Kroppenstedtia eburnea]SIS74935.1 Superfamily II DNA or RNA helicase [Kroppenstedtia eburnea]